MYKFCHDWYQFYLSEFKFIPLFRPGKRQRKDKLNKRWESRFYESQEFEPVESKFYKNDIVKQHLNDKSSRCGIQQQRSAIRWSLILLVGILTALIGVTVHVASYAIVKLKNNIVTEQMYSGRWSQAFSYHFALTISLATMGYLFVYFETGAVGSGIPEVKSFLNGVNLNNIFRVRTLVSKACSVICTVSSGMCSGPEGPMIHIGAIIGATLSRLYNTCSQGADTGSDRDWITYNSLKNDGLTRDFVTFGAAAGVAAAFRAPIGGVLFILEEGASFWSTNLTWKAFFCSCITLLSVTIMDYVLHIKGEDMTSNFSLGKFSEVKADYSEYYVIELGIFLAIGCIGGVFGAIFVSFNRWVMKFRNKYIKSNKARRYLEIIVIASLTSWMSFVAPLAWHVCSEVPEITADMSEEEINMINKLVQFDCPKGQYNEVASLFYVDSNTAIKFLFHFRDHLSSTTFGAGTLITVFVPYFFMTSATSGVMATTGEFVGCLVSGAVMGRLFGLILHSFYPNSLSDIGTYALVGSVAMFGGVCRSTISLTVMMVESTGNLMYVLPIMLSLLASKYVGDLLTPGLYKHLLKAKKLPHLNETLASADLINYLPISTFMARPVVYFKLYEKVGNVYETLKATTHNSYPILDDQGKLVGSITRSILLGIIKSERFSIPAKVLEAKSKLRQLQTYYDKGKTNGNGVDSNGHLHFHGQQMKEDVMVPVKSIHSAEFVPADVGINIDDIELDEAFYTLYIDMRQYADLSPFILLDDTSVHRTYRLFRTLGLRYLVVVNNTCKVTGIVTRKDLEESYILKFKRKREEIIEREKFEENELRGIEISEVQSLLGSMEAGSTHLSYPSEEEGARDESSNISSEDFEGVKWSDPRLRNNLAMSDHSESTRSTTNPIVSWWNGVMNQGYKPQNNMDMSDSSTRSTTPLSRTQRQGQGSPTQRRVGTVQMSELL